MRQNKIERYLPNFTKNKPLISPCKRKKDSTVPFCFVGEKCSIIAWSLIATVSTMAMANGNMAANEESDFLGSWEEMADSGVCKHYYDISF